MLNNNCLTLQRDGPGNEVDNGMKNFAFVITFVSSTTIKSCSPLSTFLVMLTLQNTFEDVILVKDFLFHLMMIHHLCHKKYLGCMATPKWRTHKVLS